MFPYPSNTNLESPSLFEVSVGGARELTELLSQTNASIAEQTHLDKTKGPAY